MAALTDPIALAFIDSRIRPRSEQLRAVAALLNDDKTAWLAGAGSLIPNDAGTTIENRTSEGIATVTGADINAIAGQFNNIITVLDGIASELAMLSVRPLDVDAPGI